MILWALKKLTALYQKRGLKGLRLSVWYDVFVERYYLLGYGVPGVGKIPNGAKLRGADVENKSRFARLPNAYLHKFSIQIDEFPHDHGRWCISIILSGGYDEWRPGWDEWRTRRPGHITFQKYDEPHLIRNLQPDCYTLFLIGPFVRDYLVYKPDGVVMSRSEMMNAGERPLTSMYRETPELLEKIAFRQKAKARFMARKSA